MRERVPVQLIHDEQAKYDYGDRIVPEPSAQEADDQPELDNAMREQIDRREIQRSCCQALDGMEKKVRNDIVGVLGEFMAGDPLRNVIEKLRADEERGDAADDLREREHGLGPQAHEEDEMDVLFAQDAFKSAHMIILTLSSIRAYMVLSSFSKHS